MLENKNFLSRLFGAILPKKDEKQKFLSPVPENLNDGSLTVDLSGFYNRFLNLGYSFQNEVDLINTYREMAYSSDVDLAVEDIVNEAIVTTDDASPTTINLDDLPDDEVSVETKEKIRVEFENILILLDYSKKAYELFKQFYIDARLYFHIIVDNDKKKEGIQELRYIDPRKIRKIRIIKTSTTLSDASRVVIVDELKEYFLFDNNGITSNDPHAMSGTGAELDVSGICFVHSGLIDPSSQTIFSHLHKAIKPHNQLKMIEDSVVIYRLTRSPERRIFYIDTGSLPTPKAEEYVKGIMNTYKNRNTYNSVDGTMSSQNLQMSMLEDIWLPRSGNSQGTQVDTLKGGENLGEMDDVVFFQKKLYKALNVPVSRLESDGGFTLGRATEITRDEIKFRKFIDKLQKRFSLLFDDLLGKQLQLKGLVTEEEWDYLSSKIKYEFASDSYFAELKQSEVWRDRISLANEAVNLGESYFSKEFIAKEFLKHTEEEIQAIQDENDGMEVNDGEIVTDDDEVSVKTPQKRPKPIKNLQDIDMGRETNINKDKKETKTKEED